MFSETTRRSRGGILKQFLKTPVYKDILRMNLNSMRPETGSQLVKTLATEDPEVFLGLASSLPIVINALTSACSELAIQLKDTYPPETLKSFMESLAGDIDTKAVGTCSGAWASLVSTLWEKSPEVRLKVRNAVISSGPGAVAGAINAAARTINTLLRDNPKVLSTFVSDVFTHTDKDEIRQATLGLAEAFLDQKWHLASWVLRLARNRIGRRFGI